MIQYQKIYKKSELRLRAKSDCPGVLGEKMFEFVYDELSPEQKDAYLERIGCPKDLPVCEETLDQLILHHQLSVPFESIDVFRGEPVIPLDRDSLFDKIVVRRRGGFCFELNGGFVMLLRAVGFDAYSVMCRVAARREVLGDIAHRATIVRLNGKRYICDVGLGGPMAPFAVEISQTRQCKLNETYWVDPLEEGWYVLRKLADDGTVGQSIVFAPQPFLQKDFVPLCAHLISKPECGFRKNRTVNLRKPDGNAALSNNTLTIRRGAVTTEETVEEERIPQVLADIFGIVL